MRSSLKGRDHGAFCARPKPVLARGRDNRRGLRGVLANPASHFLKRVLHLTSIKQPGTGELRQLWRDQPDSDGGFPNHHCRNQENFQNPKDGDCAR